MVNAKSLEYNKVLTTLLCDVQTLHSSVFTTRALRLTILKIEARCAKEGLSFLTKTLPRLGKALDRALTLQEPLNAHKLAFKSKSGSQLPNLFGELFSIVLDYSGKPLPCPSVAAIRSLRQLLYLFYKLELPYDTECEREVIDRFKRTEKDISEVHTMLNCLNQAIDNHGLQAYSSIKTTIHSKIIRRARRLISKVTSSFNPLDIIPQHGPGAVSSGEQQWSKYSWSSIPQRLSQTFPIDSYFYVSPGHVCDSLQEINILQDEEIPARVILVPKDSRGPRLISCEPLYNQWIQQGISKALVSHIERHPLTRDDIRFTDQEPNRNAALLSSRDGKYSTIDLNEASDRVSLGLVRLLFPISLIEAFEACRSSVTRLPDNSLLKLNKFAPMGSALCFPILALTIWALIRAGYSAYGVNKLPNGELVNVYVYGDDVIVPTALAAHAINTLESFGLKVNQDKSCTNGFFRESCGMDAYKGEPVTPVRIRTLWSASRRPDAFVSWISYANSLYERRYYHCYEYIVGWLSSCYGEIPSIDMNLSCPSLIEVPDKYKVRRRRTNHHLQKVEYYVYDVKPVSVHHSMSGWKMLLRWFTESKSSTLRRSESHHSTCCPYEADLGLFRSRVYTYRKRIKLLKRWR